MAMFFFVRKIKQSLRGAILKLFFIKLLTTHVGTKLLTDNEGANETMTFLHN
jgi:hypothetical protein